MFNNWLRRKDDEEKDDKEIPNTSDTNRQTEKDDDYYYYYYYESNNSIEPTIPNLTPEAKEKNPSQTELSDKGNKSTEKSENFISVETDEFSYEEDHEKASAIGLTSSKNNKISVLEDENKQLNGQLDKLDADYQRLVEEVKSLTSQVESNKSSDDYNNLLKENEDLKEKVKQSESQLEEADTITKKLEEEKNELEKTANELISTNEKSKALIETLKSENSVFADKIEELQKELSRAKEVPTQENLIIQENKRLIRELEDELNQAKELETELIKKHEMEIETNKLLMTKKEQELENMNEKLSQANELEKELNELKENQKAIQELQQELSNMRQQQQEVTANLNDLASEKSRASILEKEVSDLKSIQAVSNNDLQAELIRVKEELRLANAKAEQFSAMNQADIAQVMLEAQAKARQIVDVANYEAKRRIADSEVQLSAISQEARNYYRKLEKLKTESELVFSELLRKLESIGDIDKI